MSVRCTAGAALTALGILDLAVFSSFLFCNSSLCHHVVFWFDIPRMVAWLLANLAAVVFGVWIAVAPAGGPRHRTNPFDPASESPRGEGLDGSV